MYHNNSKLTFSRLRSHLIVLQPTSKTHKNRTLPIPGVDICLEIPRIKGESATKEGGEVKMVDKVDIILFGVIASILIVFITGSFYAIQVTATNQNNAYSQTKLTLQSQGYTVVQGEINSPAVIQITHSYAYFTEATPTNMQVYQIGETSAFSNGAFIAIFNSTYGLAYEPQFTTQLWW